VSHILLSEEELSVQVGDFNVVIVSAGDFAILGATNTHQGKCFDVFTAKSTSSHEESLHFLKLLLNFSSIDFDLVIVSAVHGCSVNSSFGESFKDIVVEPLLQWGILASELHNFLGNHSSEECSLSTDL
jgi:hypothetical protein